MVLIWFWYDTCLLPKVENSKWVCKLYGQIWGTCFFFRNTGWNGTKCEDSQTQHMRIEPSHCLITVAGLSSSDPVRSIRWGCTPWYDPFLWHSWSTKVDVGQNGRPLREPQMWMSSLVLTIHNLGVPNFDPYPGKVHWTSGGLQPWDLEWSRSLERNPIHLMAYLMDWSRSRTTSRDTLPGGNWHFPKMAVEHLHWVLCLVHWNKTCLTVGISQIAR